MSDETRPSHPEITAHAGDTVRVRIDDIAFGGDGVGRADGFVVFVPFTVVGELVDVELTEVKKRFARGRAGAIVEPSPDRVDPVCPYYGRCGGCQYQHLAYPAQLPLKRKQIRDLFERIGGFADPPVADVVPCPRPYGYRNRIMIRSQWNGREKRLHIGFVQIDNRFVVDIESCAIAEPEVSDAIAEVRADPPSRGGLKVVLRADFDDWEVPGDAFFQTNSFLLPGMVEAARDAVHAGGSRYLFDLYCGVGLFAVELAGAVDAFVGVEVDPRAIRAARRNAERRGADNGEFVAAAAEKVVPLLVDRFPVDELTVLMDPPRAGCPASMIDLLRTTRPRQIIYVSCHPATLARDLKRLCAADVYRLESVRPLDMFPQTQHVECVVDLRRR